MMIPPSKEKLDVLDKLSATDDVEEIKVLREQLKKIREKEAEEWKDCTFDDCPYKKITN